MKLLTSQEMKVIDSRAIQEYGIPGLVLMENAGLRTVEVIEEILEKPSGKSVVIVAGKGNNGGDGFVIARHLINAGVQVSTFVLGGNDTFPTDARTNFEILQRMDASILHLHQEADLDRLMVHLLTSDLIVDAMYGIGFTGSLGEFDSRIVRLINWSNRPVVAADIPSGVEADTGRVHGEAVQASYTVTFALPKIGLIVEPGKEYAGTVSVADISIPKSLLKDPALKTNLVTQEMVRALIKPRDSESHKGTYGHTLVVGGAPGLTGAVAMASMAALRSGAGLVTAALPASLVPIVDSALPEVMVTPLPTSREAVISLESLPAIENLLGIASVCAIGPGMSGYTEASAIISFVLERAGIPLVIDADGLNALAGQADILKNRQVPVVITPHPGEMSRLTGRSIKEIQSNRLAIARQYALEWGVTVVLKGNKTVIADPAGNVFVNITGNPGMATAGSGDVLCGIIASFIGQGMKAQEAAVAAVYIHGWAGDQAGQYRGQRGLVAGDLIDALPEVLRQCESGE